MYKSDVWTCITEFCSQNIITLSVGKQTNYFTACWSCQHQHGDKSCHHFWHSCSRFGPSKQQWQQSLLHPRRDPYKHETDQIILIFRTHLCPRDFWSLPCGLLPFGPAPSVSPPSFPSPSGPSSSPPELSSPLPLWPMDTISISVCI